MPTKVLDSFDRWLFAQGEADATAGAWQLSLSQFGRGTPELAMLLAELQRKQAHADEVFSALTQELSAQSMHAFGGSGVGQIPIRAVSFVASHRP